MSAVEAPTRSRTDTAAKSMAVLRIATGLLFLWAFADKAFGLGYATQSKNAWFSGGSPTKGFLSRVDVGPFESTFHAWAGTWWADLLFMAGLFAIGVAVTLRKDRMWEFVDRLITLALPRVRDFRGVSSKAFDGRGNYTLGLREQIIFPEIDYDKLDKIKGMSITFATTGNTDEHGRAMLAALGMPFRK